MDKEQLRQRFIATGVHVREAEGEGESRVLRGKAICFNEETTLWDGKYYREREIISPSCITEEFLREQDVKLNLLHNREDSIARNNKGEGRTESNQILGFSMNNAPSSAVSFKVTY